uniref:Uncharacterized protein n=1 Tax=Anopheles melas TaxID=34690 RepID=A0A182U3S2_9DIPT
MCAPLCPILLDPGLTCHTLKQGEAHQCVPPAELIGNPPAADAPEGRPGQKAHLHDAHQMGPIADQPKLGNDRLAVDRIVILVPAAAGHFQLALGRVRRCTLEVVQDAVHRQMFVRCGPNAALAGGGSLREIAPQLQRDGGEMVRPGAPKVSRGGLFDGRRESIWKGRRKTNSYKDIIV